MISNSDMFPINLSMKTGTMLTGIACRGSKVWVRMKKIATERPVVLVVEDDFLIRIGAVEMIEQGGFDVIEAANADEAIAILEIRLDITVVFTDIQMPGSMAGGGDQGALAADQNCCDLWPRGCPKD